MPNMMEMTPEALAAAVRTMALAQQNDQFRKALLHGADELTPKGRAFVTRAVAARGLDFEIAAVGAVAQFTAFTDENDPDRHRDRGRVEVQGVPVLWKIDYYDEAFEWASPDPTNKAVTRRVLTIMFPSDD